MKAATPEVLIVGAGPAGVAAAIQLKRYGLASVLLERDSVGGLLRNANLVENYPGFPNGIPGPKLAALFERQLKQVGVEVIFDELTRLEYESGWRAETRQTVYRPRVVVIASGTKPRSLPVEVPEAVRTRVFSDVWPLAGVTGARVVIIGAGDAAFDYALNLADRGNAVTILHRGKTDSCLPLLRERAASNPSIEYREQTSLQRVGIDSSSGRLALFTDCCSLFADYLLFAIGREPALDFVSTSVKQQEQELTASGKLYCAGDVHNGIFRQAAIAVGEGLRVAMQIYTNRGWSR
ncbi:MAG: NAD(P)/FAD-dependent oxidoreductase [Anaerolineales bacterium]